MSLEWLWLGQAGFALRAAGRLVLIDPYLSDHLAVKYRGTDKPHDRLMPPPWRAEEVRGVTAVLCTHRHGDHMDPIALPILAQHNPQCHFIVPRAEMKSAPVAATGINVEETLVVDGIQITAIASAHETLEANEQSEHRFLGYIVKLAGVTLYHSGDCVPYEGLPERLRQEQVDVALLPVNGRGKGVLGNFTFEEAVELCRSAGVGSLIVHHFGMFAFNTVARAGLERQAAETAAPPRVTVPHAGEWNEWVFNRKGEGSMNKVGIYYAYWTKSWDADFVPFVTKVKKLGFDILEVNSGTVTNMSNPERDRLRLAAEKAGIELTYCIGLPPKYDIASPNASVRKAGVAFLKKSAQMLKYMGNKQLGGIIYSSWPATVPEGDFDKRPYLSRSVKCMKEVMKTVEDCGVYFNVEVVNRFEQFMLNTAAEGVEYCERVGSQHCRVLLDMFHMNIEEDSIYESIVATGKHLGHVHIGETNRRAPGRGHMPWDDLFRGIRKIGYQGAIVMEPFVMTGGQVGRNISVFRDLRYGMDLDAEAKRACRFVKGKLTR